MASSAAGSVIDSLGIINGGSSGTGGAGIIVAASNAIVRNTTIRDAGGYGIGINGGADDVQVLDNVLRGAGQNSPSNDGINLRSGSNDVIIRRNQIVANMGFGIDFQQDSTGTIVEDNLIKGNGIGLTTDSSGIGIRGPTLGSDYTIRTNTLTANLGDVIVITDGHVGILISENSIYGNAQQGIDLANVDVSDGDGLTGNDALDPDTGGNNLQNFPVLVSAVSAGGTTTIVLTKKMISKLHFTFL